MVPFLGSSPSSGVPLIELSEAWADDFSAREALSIEPTASVGLRYQLESSDQQDDTLEHRARIRAALGVTVVLNRESQFVIQTRAVGNDSSAPKEADPRDGYVEVGNGLGTVGVGMHRAYFRFEPGATHRLRGFRAEIGIVPHIADASAAIWDPDLAPAGLTLSFQRYLRFARVTFKPTFFAYLVRSDLDSQAAGVIGGEFSASRSFPDLDVRLSATAMDFVRQDALADFSADNSIDADGGFAETFQVIELKANISIPELLLLPIEVHGALIENIEADNDGRGYAVGARISSRHFGGQFSADYQFRWIQRDALISGLASDDFRIASDLSGDSLELRFERGPIHVAVHGLTSNRLSGDDGSTAVDEGSQENRLRLDLGARF